MPLLDAAATAGTVVRSGAALGGRRAVPAEARPAPELPGLFHRLTAVRICRLHSPATVLPEALAPAGISHGAAEIPAAPPRRPPLTPGGTCTGESAGRTWDI
jgi:hypothetical protein